MPMPNYDYEVTDFHFSPTDDHLAGYIVCAFGSGEQLILKADSARLHLLRNQLRRLLKSPKRREPRRS